MRKVAIDPVTQPGTRLTTLIGAPIPLSIEQQALQLGKLRQRVSDALASGDFDAWLDLFVQVVTAEEKLRDALLRDSVHVVNDPKATRVLADFDLSEIEDIDAVGESLLYSWFMPSNYAVGISRVDALIAPVPVPATLSSFVEEARQCYAFQQPNAVYSLSRTILLVGIEVKKTSSPTSGDFKGLRNLSEQTGKRFLRGILLYTGSTSAAFGPNLHAVPVSALWQLEADLAEH